MQKQESNKKDNNNEMSATTALLNIVAFLPYFFSVSQMWQTLFDPWKGTGLGNDSTNQSLGFKDRMAANLVSRGIGFMMRSSLLGIYCVFQIALVFLLPFFIIFYLLFGNIINKILSPKRNQIDNEIEKNNFISSHTIESKNTPLVASWYDYLKSIDNQQNLHPLSLESLLKIPPLGRDWKSGYTPHLDMYSVDLTMPRSHWHHLLDRKEEIHQIELALSTSQNANVILLGETGVGKQTLVEGFAKCLASGKTIPQLQYKRLVKLDISKVIASVLDKNERDIILKKILHEANLAKNIILYIPNLSDYFSTNANAIVFENVFMDFLDSNNLTFITTSTQKSYQKYFAPLPQISSHFNQIVLKELAKNETQLIMYELLPDFEKKWGRTMTIEALSTVLELGNYYLLQIPQPEKTIAIVDGALQLALDLNTNKVTPNIVEQYLKTKSHILDNNLVGAENLKNISAMLSKQIIGQDFAISKITSSLQKTFILKNKDNKPLASFLLIGPTGVGKTETAKTIAKILFNDEKKLIRFDMSEYQTLGDIAKLIGNSTNSEPGLLTTLINANPTCVLLLDEIEKSPKELLNIFLSILDEGYFQDSEGKKVDCRHLLIVATSNAGAKLLFDEKIKSQTIEAQEKILVDELIEKNIFTPEFLNRFDSILTFLPLTIEAVTKIAIYEIEKISQNLQKNNNRTIKVDRKYLDGLIQSNYDIKFGARDIKRIVKDNIEAQIAQKLIEAPNLTGEIMIGN